MEYDLKLYIQIRDGQPFEHPILHDNFVAAFPHLDTENLPRDRFAPFVRVAPPELEEGDVYVGVTYQWVGDVVKDVHEVIKAEKPV